MSPKKKYPKPSPETVIPPPKQTDIVNVVKDLVERDLFAPTGHAKARIDRRDVTILEVKKILTRRSSRESKKDVYKEVDDVGNVIKRWSYAFKGKIDNRTLRVCVSIVGGEIPLLIVTVVDLD